MEIPTTHKIASPSCTLLSESLVKTDEYLFVSSPYRSFLLVLKCVDAAVATTKINEHRTSQGIHRQVINLSVQLVFYLFN